MKIYTSYFYQLRFFKPYMIPLSTALGDPFWYHDKRGNSYVFTDKNSVINGLRILPLVPDSNCSNLCKGREGCDRVGQGECDFLDKYYCQLSNIDFADFMSNLEKHISTICSRYGIQHEPVVALMVHEAANNLCSERIPIQRWFADNGVIIEELNPKEW